MRLKKRLVLLEEFQAGVSSSNNKTASPVSKSVDTVDTAATATKSSAEARAEVIKDVDGILANLERLSAEVNESMEFIYEFIDDCHTILTEEQAKEAPNQETINTILEAYMEVIEEFDVQLTLNEAGDDGVGKKIWNFVFHAPRARKAQNKVNKVKLMKKTLDMAADEAPDAEQKKKLKDKSVRVTQQVKDLQAAVDDRFKDKGEYVQGVLKKTKIEGQMAVIKAETGHKDGLRDKQDAKDHMQRLVKKAKEEDEVLKELEPSAEDKEKGVIEVRIKELEDTLPELTDAATRGEDAEKLEAKKKILAVKLEISKLKKEKALIVKDGEKAPSTKTYDKEIADYEKQIKELGGKSDKTAEIEAVQTKIDELNQQLADNNQKLTADPAPEAEEKLNLEKERLTLKIAIKAQEKKKAELEEKDTAEFDTEIADLQTQLSELEGGGGQDEDEVSEIDQKIADKEQEIKNKKDELQALASAAGGDADDVENLSRLEDEIEDLRDQIRTEEAKEDSDTARVEELKSQRDAKKAELDTIEAKYADASDEERQQTQALGEELRRLKDELKALKAEKANQTPAPEPQNASLDVSNMGASITESFGFQTSSVADKFRMLM